MVARGTFVTSRKRRNNLKKSENKLEVFSNTSKIKYQSFVDFITKCDAETFPGIDT